MLENIYLQITKKKLVSFVELVSLDHGLQLEHVNIP